MLSKLAKIIELRADLLARNCKKRCNLFMRILASIYDGKVRIITATRNDGLTYTSPKAFRLN